MNRLFRGLILSILAGGALYGLLAAAYGDLSRVSHHLARFPTALFFASLLLACLNYLLRFARWQHYLRVLAIPVPRGSSLRIFLSGFALTITPGKIGELLKSYLLKKCHGAPLSRSAPIVGAERLTDLLALLILGFFGISSFMGRRELWLLVAGLGLCAGFILVATSRRLSHAAIGLLGRLLPASVAGRLVPRLHDFYDATAMLLLPRTLLVATVLSILSWFCECVAFFVVLKGFQGVSASLLLSTFIYAMMTVAGALAFVPGGLGVTEGGMALLLARLARGVDESVAVAATLIIRAATLWFAVLLGVIALGMTQRRLRDRLDLEGLRALRSGRDSPSRPGP